MTMNGKNIFTLAQLNKSIELHLQKVNASFWIKAEISQLQYHNGHAYLDLIEKKEGAIIAKNRATIWNSELLIFQHRLKSLLGEVLKNGVNILIEITVHYHPVYGLSLQVEDLDETFSIGELERLKRETIEKLTKQGVFNLQQKLSIPIVPQQIAIISSNAAAGYEDFYNQLTKNNHLIKFNCSLFHTKVQGDGASNMIRKAIAEINPKDFDVIVIIRGGGSKADLLAFDDYELALDIARCSLPVLTGIGHERDEAIADMVSFLKFKTPTAVANYLIDHVNNFQLSIDELYVKIQNMIDQKVVNATNTLKVHVNKTLPSFRQKIEEENHKVEKRQLKITHFLNRKVEREKLKLTFTEKFFRNFSAKQNKDLINKKWEAIQSLFKYKLREEVHKMSLLEVKIESKDPKYLLKKGYSMTLLDGKLADPTNLKVGDKIQTITNKKIIDSTVDKVSENL